MKKTNLRLLSMMLGVITLFSGAPVRGEGNFKDVKNKTGSIPFGLKVAAGVGITGALTVGVIAGCYALAKNKSSSADQECSVPQAYLTQDSQRQASPVSVRGYGSGNHPNANFSNTRNLCYWHALLQNLYDIKAFKKFIKEYDENFIDNTDTQKKILALREIFNAMGECSGGVLSRDKCEMFANEVFGGKKWSDGESILGNQQDPSEVCTKFMPDVMNLYAGFVNCGGDGSNIFMNSVKLRPDKHLISLDDVLRENLPDELARCDAINNYCWSNEERRLSILRRLPVSCLLSRDEKESIAVSETGFTVDNDVINNLFESKNISELPDGIKNLIINDFSEDPKKPSILDNDQSLGEIKSNWNSSDLKMKKDARLRIFSSAPISDFVVKDEQSGKWGIDRAKLGELVNGKKSFEDAIKCLKNLEHAKTECVKDALDTCDLPYIRVPVIEGQFSIFISRLVFNTAVNEGIKDDIPVYFGDGTVRFGANGLFELTAVTVHSGSGMGGHYYTYKKQGGIWWKYDDLNNKPAHRVSWDGVKEDSQRKCVMLTFSKKGTDVKEYECIFGNTTKIVRLEPLDMENYFLDIISQSHLNPKFSKDKFEIVNTGEGTPYPRGIVDRQLLSGNKYGKIAIVDAANTSGLGGGGVDGAIFKAMGEQDVVNDIRANLPCYANSDTRIKEGGAIVHGSYKIGEDIPNVSYVVQVVSPKLRSEIDLPLFYSAWYNAVRLGARVDCDTIFMPGIGMGVFCENKSLEFAKKCAKVAVQAIKDAIRDSGKASIKIVIVDHHDERRSAGFFDELKKMTN